MFPNSRSSFLIIRSGGIGDIFHLYPILIDIRDSGCKVDLFLFHYAENKFFNQIFKSEYFSKIITLSEGKIIAFKKIIQTKYSNVLILPASNETRFSIFKKQIFSVLTGNFFKTKILTLQNISNSKTRHKINTKRVRAPYEPDLLLNFYNNTYNRKAKRKYDIVLRQFKNKIFNDKFDVFILGTNNDVNRLPEKKWLDIALNINNSKTLVLLGGKSEINYSENLVSILSDFKVFNLTGKLSIANSVYVISKATKVFSHDTGIMHIAAAMKVNLTVFLSARDQFGRWHPTNKESRVMYEYQECGFCMLASCPYNKKCLIESVDKLINNKYD